MWYAVYVDFPRQLTNRERSTVADALDSNVPGSGCVGLQNGPNDEMYFAVEAPSDEEAAGLASDYACLVLRHAGLNDEYSITLQTTDGGFRNWTL